MGVNATTGNQQVELIGSSTSGPLSKPAAATDTVTAAANVAAVLTYAAQGAGIYNVIGLVAWSYSAAPTAGLLKIEDGAGNIVFQQDITAAGPGSIAFPTPLKGTANTALVVTLAAAGAAVVGRVNARYWRE